MPRTALLLAFLFLATDGPRVETRDGKRTITNAPRATTKTKNILIVGNSLTYFNEMPWLLEQIAASKDSDPPLRVVFSGRSGLTLEQHWKRGRARKTIEEQPWDFVVLQEQSTAAVREPERFAEYARKFDEVIRRRGAKTVIVETWAPRASLAVQRDFRLRYESVARELKAQLAPVGEAWDDLRKRGIDLFDAGGLHPNVAGSYLYASVLYALAYERSAEDAVHTFDVHFEIREFYRKSLEEDRIDAVTAQAIHGAAWRAVRRGVEAAAPGRRGSVRK